jgi:hypothetical protein
VFLRLVVLHLKYKEKAQLFQHLTHINEAEIGYLNGDLSPFKTGEKYTDTAHAYAHDLDIFGQGSIFQHINRTTTQLGESHLAFLLKNEIPVDISAQQKAVKELSELLDWRQHFMAAGLMEIDEDLNIRQFENWLNRPFYYQNASILRGLSYVLPVITLVALVVFAVTNDSSHFSILKGLFITNLAFVAVQQKHIKEEHQLLSSMGSVLKKYGKLLQNIENQDFSAEILRGYTQPNARGSKAIKRLSTISNNFDTILNPIAALLTNGLFQYHIHALFALEKWRAEHKDAVFAWFQTIAKFEALSSIANFAYNNPDFTTPTIESEPILILKQVGHPLIKKEKRICNNVAFYKTKFIVLTGSNMSGKSTFLRTLGVNLILARVGAPVQCMRKYAY